MRTIFPVESISRLDVRWEDALLLPTPVEERNGLLYKREDYFAPLGYGGINGAKLRQLVYLVSRYVDEGGEEGILTGASVLSPQVSMAALVARHYGLPATVVLGATKPESALRHENVAIAAEAGADFVYVPVGFNPALQRAVADLHAAGYAFHYRLNYGITTPTGAPPEDVAAFHSVAAEQARYIPPQARTIVMTAGSCNSCVGVLLGLALHDTNVERVVLIGVGPTRLAWIEERLHLLGSVTGVDVAGKYRRLYHHHAALEAEHQTSGPILLEHYDLHSTGFATYSDRMPFTLDTIAFHPTYEGKMLWYLHERRGEFDWFHGRDGSVLVWIVGSAPSRAAMSAALFVEGVGLA